MNFKNLFVNFGLELVYALLIFVFCIAPNLSTIPIIILVLFVVVQSVRKKMVFHPHLIHWIFFLFFFAYLFGALVSPNLGEAINSVSRKLSFLILPLVMMWRKKEIFNLKIVAIGFLIGVLCVSILGVVNSFNAYVLHGDFNNSFGSTTFSYVHHPTYFSSFLLIALELVRFGSKQGWRYFNQITLTIAFIFTLTMQFFCFSFAGLLILFLYLFVLTYATLYQKLKRSVFLLSLLLIPTLPAAVYYSNIHIQIEIDTAIRDVNEYFNSPSKIYSKVKEDPSGNSVRLTMWSVSAELLAENPFGYGVANIDKVIGNRLRMKGLDDLAKHNYNPHNQYLQTGLELGFLGVMIFILILVVALIRSIKDKNTVLLVIMFSLIMNSFFESMLQRQSGIIFFTFWICLFAMLLKNKTKNSQ